MLQDISEETIGSKYEVVQLLGQGAFGKVYLAVDKKNQKYVAVKAIPNLQGREKILREVNFLRMLSYQPCDVNILCYHDVLYDKDDENVYLVTEYVSGSNIPETIYDLKKRYAADNESLYLNLVLQLLRDMLRALAYVHNFGIVHGDIKSENVIVRAKNQFVGNGKNVSVTDTFEPVLIDFGLACLWQNIECQRLFGTPSYMAPERFTDNKIYPQSDLWSLGILFYEALFGDPWHDLPEMSTEIFGQYIVSGQYDFTIETNDSILNSVLKILLKHNYKDRSTAQELYDYISKFSPSTLTYDTDMPDMEQTTSSPIDRSFTGLNASPRKSKKSSPRFLTQDFPLSK